MDLQNKLSSLSVNPQKVLKIVIGLSFILLLMWLFTLSQIDNSGGSENPRVFSDDQTVDTLSVESGREDSQAPIGSGGDKSSDIFSNGLITFFFLVVILAIIWFWVDKKGGSVSQSQSRQIGSHVLGEGAQLKIIKLNQEYWVLGVTANSVDLLHRYPKEEWKETLEEQESGGEDTFAKLFRSKL